jgi:hypothetical protein
MVEFLQANWFWLLLGVGVLWFLFRQGGCSMGGHGPHGSESSRRTTARSDNEHAGHGEEQSTHSTARRSRRGCC